MQNDPMQNDPMQNDPSQADDTQATPNRAPLPPWLRAQMGEDYQEPAAPATNAETPTQQTSPAPDHDLGRDREIAQLRAEVNQLRQRSTYGLYQERTRGRGGCLTTWLVLQSIGIALIALFACMLATQGAPGYALFVLATVVYTAISIGGLWQLKRWGYNMQMIGYVISLIISGVFLCISSSNGTGSSSIFFGDVIGTALGMLILFLLVHDRQDVFD